MVYNQPNSQIYNQMVKSNKTNTQLNKHKDKCKYLHKKNAKYNPQNKNNFPKLHTFKTNTNLFF